MITFKQFITEINQKTVGHVVYSAFGEHGEDLIDYAIDVYGHKLNKLAADIEMTDPKKPLVAFCRDALSAPGQLVIELKLSPPNGMELKEAITWWRIAEAAANHAIGAKTVFKRFGTKRQSGLKTMDELIADINSRKKPATNDDSVTVIYDVKKVSA